MRRFLVISKSKRTFNIIKECFQPDGYLVDNALNKNLGLAMLGKKRYDFIFIDLELLKNFGKGTDYK
ncbi:MAG: hypothetical protein N3A64_04610, partial [Desulfobacterota bacterium]|nr:hypothetical protein [Thermodesulfobacteriota bacterium]